MVAPVKTRNSRVVCVAVRVDDVARLRDGSLAPRPSELVPWTDPYIAALVRRLQSEVRFERAGVAAAAPGMAASPYADLDPPGPADEAQWEGFDQPRWSEIERE